MPEKTLPGKKINEIRKDILVPTYMSEPAFETAPMHEIIKRSEAAMRKARNVEVEER